MAKILIIDDDKKIVDLFVKTLKEEGHQVAEATDGDTAGNVFNEFLPEIVITDILMPGKDGTELIFQLKKEFPEIKIIAISGGGIIGPEGYLEAAEKAGANYTFTKPLNIREIIKAIETLLEK